MADKYVKTFKIGEETYDVLSANDNEQNTKIEELETSLQTITDKYNELKENYEAFVVAVGQRIDELEAKINYDEQDQGNDQSSNND